jgi:hypothetical protein
MIKIHHRKTIYWYEGNQDKPHAFFALDDHKKVYLCVVVETYSPVQGDGIPDIFMCREVDRKDIQKIYRLSLNELSELMRLTFQIYVFETDMWSPRKVLLQPVEYSSIPDSWWASSMEDLIHDQEKKKKKRGLQWL